MEVENDDKGSEDVIIQSTVGEYCKNKQKKYNHPGTAKHDHLLWTIMEEWFKSYSEFDFLFIMGKKLETGVFCVEV